MRRRPPRIKRDPNFLDEPWQLYLSNSRTARLVAPDDSLRPTLGARGWGQPKLSVQSKACITDARHQATFKESGYRASSFPVHGGIRLGMTSKKRYTGRLWQYPPVSAANSSPYRERLKWASLTRPKNSKRSVSGALPRGLSSPRFGNVIVGPLFRSCRSQFLSWQSTQFVSCNVTLFSSAFHTNGSIPWMTSWTFVAVYA